MARKRMIDPEFFLDEELAKTHPLSRLLYIGSWGICDDNYHTFPNRPEWIKAQVFPYEDIDISVHIKELVKAGKWIAFESDGKQFFFVKNFGKYQRVDRPSAAKYPAYPGVLDEYSMSTRPEVKLSKVKLSKVYTPDFEDFWKSYPKKVGKVKTFEFWQGLSAGEKKLALTDVPKRMEDDKWVGGFIKDPERYIKNRQWEDEIIIKKKKGADDFTKQPF